MRVMRAHLRATGSRAKARELTELEYAKVADSEMTQACRPLVRGGTLPPYSNKRPVYVDERLFESLTDAARAFNLTREGARKRIQSPNYPAWRYADG